jgi:translation initiation factor 1
LLRLKNPLTKMSNNDWQAALGALLADGNLPEGEEPKQEPPKPTKHPRLDIILERKGRAGKVATIVSGFTLSDDELQALATRLKSKLGTGGSARGGEILVQGDRRTRLQELLSAEGFTSRII